MKILSNKTNKSFFDRLRDSLKGKPYHEVISALYARAEPIDDLESEISPLQGLKYMIDKIESINNQTFLNKYFTSTEAKVLSEIGKFFSQPIEDLNIMSGILFDFDRKTIPSNPENYLKPFICGFFKKEEKTFLIFKKANKKATLEYNGNEINVSELNSILSNRNFKEAQVFPLKFKYDILENDIDGIAKIEIQNSYNKKVGEAEFVYNLGEEFMEDFYEIRDAQLTVRFFAPNSTVTKTYKIKNEFKYQGNDHDIKPFRFIENRIDASLRSIVKQKTK